MKRGDIYVVGLEPAAGREQRGKRHAIVVSRADMNKKFLPIVCPITGGGVAPREAGVAVSLQGAGLRTDGVVLCHQVRALDIKERNGKFVEQAPDYIVTEVLAALQDMFADE